VGFTGRTTRGESSDLYYLSSLLERDWKKKGKRERRREEEKGRSLFKKGHPKA